jgi:hypothetical protein
VDRAKVRLPLAGELLDGLAKLGDLLLLLSDLPLLHGKGAAHEGAKFVVGRVGTLDGAVEAVVGKLLFDARYALVSLSAFCGVRVRLVGMGACFSV